MTSSIKGLAKVQGLERIWCLNLPTVQTIIIEPSEGTLDVVRPAVLRIYRTQGFVSLRTDCNRDRAGSTPFLFMEADAERAVSWGMNRLDAGYWLIVTESVKPEDVLVQAHVPLAQEFGRWKLLGEANNQCVTSWRQAVQRGTRKSGLRLIAELPKHQHLWGRLYSMLRKRWIFNRQAEVTITKDNRFVFWEVEE